MSDSDQPGRRWFLQMQSAYVLPLARGICLLIALACLVMAIGGIGYAVLLQASITGQPAPIPVPPPYQDAEPAEADGAGPAEGDDSMAELSHVDGEGRATGFVVNETMTAKKI